MYFIKAKYEKRIYLNNGESIKVESNNVENKKAEKKNIELE